MKNTRNYTSQIIIKYCTSRGTQQNLVHQKWTSKTPLMIFQNLHSKWCGDAVGVRRSYGGGEGATLAQGEAERPAMASAALRYGQSEGGGRQGE